MSESVDYDRYITITGFNKVGKGIASYVSYNIETKILLGFFLRGEPFTVTRRYTDFLGLHEKLVEKYLKSGYIIPPAPEKDFLGTTRVRISGSQSEQNTSSAEFLERRRAALERFLSRIASHPILGKDPDFHEFVESEGELPKSTSTSMLSGAGFIRFLSKVAEADKPTFKMKEIDPWFDQKNSLMKNIDVQLRRMLRNVEELFSKRKELASHTTEFAKSSAMLSNCEEHTGLSRALSQLADLEEKIENQHTEQANDAIILCDLFKDYIALIVAVRDTFNERVKLYQHWKNGEMTLAEKVKQNKKPLKMGELDASFKAHAEVSEVNIRVF